MPDEPRRGPRRRIRVAGQPVRPDRGRFGREPAPGEAAGPPADIPSYVEPTALAGVQPSVAEPSVADAARAEPAAVEPAVGEPAVGGNAVGEQAVAEPPLAETGFSEPQPAVAEPVRWGDLATDEAAHAEPTAPGDPAPLGDSAAARDPVTLDEQPAAYPATAVPAQDQFVDEAVAGPDVAVPDVAVPGVAVPDQAVPGHAVPDQAMPGQTAPDQAVPDWAVASVASEVAAGSGVAGEELAAGAEPAAEEEEHPPAHRFRPLRPGGWRRPRAERPRSWRNALPVGLAAIIVGLAVVLGFLESSVSAMTSASNARGPALAAAETDTQNFLTVDYRHLHADLAKANAGLTQAFRRQYDSFQAKAAPTYVKNQYILAAAVAAGGLTSVSSTHARALLFVDEVGSGKNFKADSYSQVRVYATMVNVNGRWLMSGLTVV